MNNAPSSIKNHIAIVIDESWSMTIHQQTLIRVVDAQIEHLALRAQELGQETRISIYTFSNEVRCPIFDTDVQRVPSLQGKYSPDGRTALIDATLQSQEELEQTPQLHGEHSFLTFVLTDGEENQSRRRAPALRQYLESQPAHWTVACLVPDTQAKHWAKQAGFPPENIAIWDATSRRGLEEAGSVIRQATEVFMTGRAKGIRGSRAIFSTGIDAVNKGTVQSALDLLDPSTYQVLAVTKDTDIKGFFATQPVAFRQGRNFYQFTKRETIQHSKDILVREKATGRVYGGQHARELLGLQMTDIRDKPGYNPEYDIFVQSKSSNRRLIAGTDLILMH